MRSASKASAPPVDLRESYFAPSRYFSGLLFAYVTATMLQAYLARGSVEWTLVATVMRLPFQ